MQQEPNSCLRCSICALEILERLTAPGFGRGFRLEIADDCVFCPFHATDAGAKPLLASLFRGCCVGMNSRLVVLVVAAWLAFPLAPCLADNASLAEIRAKAERGDVDAQLLLGEEYHEGDRVPRDYAEAAKWMRKAAEQGNASAQFGLGLMYDHGEGVARDYAEAVKLYRKSAEQGFMFAQYFLGVHYLRKAVPRDYAEAAKWMRKAAEQGNATAQIQLGVMYQEGIGVPRDYAGAYMWFSLAAAKGHEDARKALDAIRPVMTPDQIAEAQKRTAAWKPSR